MHIMPPSWMPLRRRSGVSAVNPAGCAGSVSACGVPLSGAGLQTCEGATLRPARTWREAVRPLGEGCNPHTLIWDRRGWLGPGPQTGRVEAGVPGSRLAGWRAAVGAGHFNLCLVALGAPFPGFHGLGSADKVGINQMQSYMFPGLGSKHLSMTLEVLPDTILLNFFPKVIFPWRFFL